MRSVERCRQPNGAYTYSVNAIPRHLRMESINQVKGSLGRIQVCNYALTRAGAELPEESLEVGVRLGQASEFSLLVAVLAQGSGILSAAGGYLVQLTTMLTFVVSPYLIVMRYPTPIAIRDSLRRD